MLALHKKTATVPCRRRFIILGKKMAEITLQCDECEEDITINQSDFEYESVASDERDMGVEVTYEGTVEASCPNGHYIEVTHRFWEYPEHVENHREIEVRGATIIDDKL